MLVPDNSTRRRLKQQYLAAVSEIEHVIDPGANAVGRQLEQQVLELNAFRPERRIDVVVKRRTARAMTATPPISMGRPARLSPRRSAATVPLASCQQPRTSDVPAARSDGKRDLVA